jgi:hypothetical protein
MRKIYDKARISGPADDEKGKIITKSALHHLDNAIKLSMSELDRRPKDPKRQDYEWRIRSNGEKAHVAYTHAESGRMDFPEALRQINLAGVKVSVAVEKAIKDGYIV